MGSWSWRKQRTRTDVYYYLVSALKRRLILELQDSFAEHPVYNKVVPYIQNRYAFDERPQFGIVVKGSAANKVQLAADNYIGPVMSHVMLAYVGAPKYPMEWVREDLARVNANDGLFPLQAGVYYIDILSAPTNDNEEGSFRIRPYLTVSDEPVLRFQTGLEREAQLQQHPAPGTLRLWDNGRILLREGTDYTADAEGAIILNYDHSPNMTLTADYRYTVPAIGPKPFHWNTADFETLPGVVMAFGKRASAGDTVAVVVYQDRVDAAQAYGGKFEVSFDFDVISMDPTQMEEMADLVVMYLWGVKKAALEYEGIEIIDVSIGGEAEESYDDTADTYYFTASLSIQLRADWEVHVPLPLTVSKVTPTSAAGDAAAPPGQDGPSRVHEVYGDLFFQTHPSVVGRNFSFERIG